MRFIDLSPDAHRRLSGHRQRVSARWRTGEGARRVRVDACRSIRPTASRSSFSTGVLPRGPQRATHGECVNPVLQRFPAHADARCCLPDSLSEREGRLQEARDFSSERSRPRRSYVDVHIALGRIEAATEGRRAEGAAPLRARLRAGPVEAERARRVARAHAPGLDDADRLEPHRGRRFLAGDRRLLPAQRRSRSPRSSSSNQDSCRRWRRSPRRHPWISAAALAATGVGTGAVASVGAPRGLRVRRRRGRWSAALFIAPPHVAARADADRRWCWRCSRSCRPSGSR